MNKTLALLLSLSLLGGTLCGCRPAAAPAQETAQETADEENYDTGDASLDDPLNQDGIGEKELLVVSFGTSFNDSRRETIGAVEKDLIAAYPEYSVRRGFTSQIIIDHVLRRDGEKIDNITEALDRAVNNGVKHLVVQPTHLMSGYEYNDVVKELAQYADAFASISVGRPLLDTEEDFDRVADAIIDATKEYDDGETAIVFMGHGTEAESNEIYAKMQETLTRRGGANYFLGTVEAKPDLEDVLAAVKAGSYKKVVLEPLMVVSGDHANNDMAGDEEDSWKSAFLAAGYEVTCLLRGLGELEPVRQLYVEHAGAAMGPAHVATAADMTTVEEVTEPGMIPVYAESLREGTWPVAMKSSSSMFKAESCQVRVSEGKLTAVLHMTSEAYSHMYAGTAAEAAAAPETDLIPLTEEAEGKVFLLPLEALDRGESFAAYSTRKELWYDRTLLFRSDSLPAEAFAEGYLTTAESLGLKDGSYTAEVTLAGGSGKATVESPAALTVSKGVCTARIVWGSPNYDYMTVGDEQYLPVNTEGNSVFEIPVTVFDRPMSVLADTTAMSQPYEIAYALTFSSESIQPA